MWENHVPITTTEMYIKMICGEWPEQCRLFLDCQGNIAKPWGIKIDYKVVVITIIFIIIISLSQDSLHGNKLHPTDIV